MSWHHPDLTAAMRRIADSRIEEAMAQGKFDNLRGAQQDLVLDDMPADEETRMTWWCLRILRHNDVIPDQVQWLKQIDGLKAVLGKTIDPLRRQSLVRQINDLVHRINTLGTNALQAPVAPMSVEPSSLIDGQ